MNENLISLYEKIIEDKNDISILEKLNSSMSNEEILDLLVKEVKSND